MNRGMCPSPPKQKAILRILLGYPIISSFSWIDVRPDLGIIMVHKKDCFQSMRSKFSSLVLHNSLPVQSTQFDRTQCWNLSLSLISWISNLKLNYTFQCTLKYWPMQERTISPIILNASKKFFLFPLHYKFLSQFNFDMAQSNTVIGFSRFLSMTVAIFSVAIKFFCTFSF